MNKKYTYEEVLEKDGKLIYRNVGTSMLPLIRENRDLIIIEKKGRERLKKYDVVLYKRANGQYVLHRIIKVREADYIISHQSTAKINHGINSQFHRAFPPRFHTGMARTAKTVRLKNDPDILFPFFISSTLTLTIITGVSRFKP